VLILLAASGDALTEALPADWPAGFAEVEAALTDVTAGFGMCAEAEDFCAAEGLARSMGATPACPPLGEGFAGAGFTLTLAAERAGTAGFAAGLCASAAVPRSTMIPRFRII
jgi:hypothetical protein